MIPRHNIKGIIFDLDGILIDSFGAIEESYIHAVTSLGLPLIDAEEFRGKIGVPLEDFFAQTISLSGQTRADLVSIAVRLFRERYSQIYLIRTSLMKDAAEVVKELYSKGIKLAVATNKLGRFSREILKHFSLEKFFSSVIGAGDGIPPKPAPEILLRALTEMGVERDKAFYIGDTPVDIETGANADIPVIAIATGYYTETELRSAGASYVFLNLAEILKILK